MKYSTDELYKLWGKYTEDKPAGTEVIAFIAWLKLYQKKKDEEIVFALKGKQKEVISNWLTDIGAEINMDIIGDAPLTYSFVPSAIGTNVTVNYRGIAEITVDEEGNII